MRLKELREERALTQKEVADAIGGTQSNLGKWEKGKTQPPADMVAKLADFFEVSMDYLLGRSDDLGNVTVQNAPLSLSQSEKELLRLFNSLPAPMQTLSISMLRTLAGQSDTKQ